MKEIWINLELYFESYEFSNFRDFFIDFSEFIFEFSEFKIIKKRARRGLVFARTHVDATWHGRPRARATRTRANAYVAQM